MNESSPAGEDAFAFALREALKRTKTHKEAHTWLTLISHALRNADHAITLVRYAQHWVMANEDRTDLFDCAPLIAVFGRTRELAHIAPHGSDWSAAPVEFIVTDKSQILTRPA